MLAFTKSFGKMKFYTNKILKINGIFNKKKCP